MIIFKRVSCKNFFSVGNQPIEIFLNKSPTTLVAGGNGSGKSSTILDSIYFGLFGKPFRNINKPNIVNSINNADLVVEIEFDVGGKEYHVIRGMKPNKFEIYENGILINQDSAARDYQKHLEENILGGLNERVFKQVVVIGSADYRPFMQLPSAQRREIIEELLDIKIFSQMLDIAKEKMSTIKESLRDLDYSIELSEAKVALEKSNREKAKQEAEGKKETLQNKIAEEEEKIKLALESVAALTDKKNAYSQKLMGHDLLKKSITDLQKLLNNLTATKKNNTNTVAFFNDNNSCPTCKQDIEQEHKEEILSVSSKKIAELDAALDKVKKELDKKLANLDIYEKIQKGITKLDREIFQEETNVKTAKRFIDSYNEEIADLGKKKTAQSDEMKTLIADRDRLKDSRTEKLSERQYYEAVSGMLKDGGIKTKIIRQYIPIMNKIINDYLIRFGLPIEFTLDEQFNEVIKSRYRDGFQYNNFSEGEKQRIDTALLLAWRSIAKAKNTTNTNLLVMDETFDSSLDAAATEELLNMLLEMDKNTNIFIISHKQDLSDKLRSHIEFEKVGNFTRIKPRPD